MKRCPSFPLVVALLVVEFAVSPTRADLIVASYFNNEILRYDDMTGQLIGPFGTDASSPLLGPLGMIPLRDHHLLVSSSGTNQVLQFDTATGAPEGIFASGTGLIRPGGVISGPDGDIYVGSSANSFLNSGVVKRYDGTTGAFLGDFTLQRPDGGGFQVLHRHWCLAPIKTFMSLTGTMRRSNLGH